LVVGETTPRAARVAFWLLLAGVLVHLGFGLAGHGGEALIGTWLSSGLEIAAAAVIASRVLRVPEQRLAWGLFCGYVALNAAGDLVWSVLAPAAATARELGLAGEPVDEVARAAQLHDTSGS
jgi:hypothetical protein